MSGGKVTWRDIPSPDWCMVGAPLDDGVVILASRHLTYAKLSELATDTVYLEEMTAGWMRTGAFVSVHAGMDDHVLVGGRDYAEAFAVLFGQWTPPTGQTRELLAGVVDTALEHVGREIRELESGLPGKEASDG